MNKTLKKIISSFLIIGLVLSYIPTDIVFANYQSYVTDLTIGNTTTKVGNNKILLNWSMPAISTTPDTGAIITDQEALHEPEGYNIFYRNGSAKQAYSDANKKNVTDVSSDILSYTFTDAMKDNSIYSFYVEAYHTHRKITDAANNLTTSYVAPKEKNGTNLEVLSLSNITISEVNSLNGGFEVTWGNPTYMGANVFSGYRLYYTPDTDSTINTDTSPFISMSVDSPDATLNSAAGTIKYTFAIPDVIVGQEYSIKIEPLYNSIPFRLKGLAGNEITINGQDYMFAYPDKNYEFRFDGAYVKPSLYIKQEGTDNIRLYWNPISSTSGTVSSIKIYSSTSTSEEETWLNIGTIASSSATSINSWLLPTPNTLTKFKIVIEFDNGTVMESNLAYYDPSYSEFDPYKPIIHKVETDTTRVVPNFTMYWQAFLRKPYNETETAELLSKYKLYNDTNLSYQIWVTDDLTNLNNNYFTQYVLVDKAASSFKSTDLAVDGGSTLAYFTTLNQYYSFVDGVAELKSLEGNKIYYIKIMATRDGTLETSEAEYYSIYLPPTGDIDINPLTMGTPPLRIAKDNDGADIITDKSITVEWDTVWYEVYDKSNDTWHGVVGKDDSGNIVYGKAAMQLENQDNVLYLYDSEVSAMALEGAKEFIESFLGIGDTDDLPTRRMDITGSNYEIFTVQYNYLEEQGGYEQFYSTIADSEKWKTISPNVADTNLTYEVTTEQAPSSGELLPNTSYVVYMRTYTIDSNGNKIYAYNPSYVVGNTTEKPTDVIVTPPAQFLEAVSSTAMSATFRWEYSSAFNYTLKFSNKTQDYTEGGLTIESDEIKENGVIKIEGNKTYIYYTINNLFPETTYYAWVNAKNGKLVSDWSAPASIATLELETPRVPTGLGPMGTENVKIINEANDTTYTPLGEDYIIIEWNRLYYDTELPASGIVADDKGYGEEILYNELFTNSYGVKFNSLNANTRYYFRVKSRLIAIRQSDGSAELKYAYVISMADNEDFIDAIEFEVPASGVEHNGIDVIVKESKWSNTVSLFSGKSGNEYDGDFDPELYPLPEEDYEIIYSNGELQYIFRGPGLDSSGMPNNGVDQRFISTVINDKIYDFSVDLSRYKGEDVAKSKVVIPYSIISALNSQKVTLTMKTGNMFTKVDLAMFSDAIKNQNISGVNKNTKAEISFVDNPNMAGLLTYGQAYVSTPQLIKVSLITDTRTVQVTALQRPIDIGMYIDNRYLTQDKNVGMYKQIGGSASDWASVPSTYDKATNKFAHSTKSLGTFTVISKDVPTFTGNNTSPGDVDTMYSVNSSINITDMPYYNPATTITANQYNNIVWAVVKDNTQVTMNKTLDQTAYTELGRGKLLVSGTYVTREKGIAVMARLYELKTGEAIVPASTLANQGYSDSSSVGSDYTNGVNKAIELGMVSGSKIRPSENMTFGEFMSMLEFVVLDK